MVDNKVIEDFMGKENETSILKRVMLFSLNNSNNKRIEVSVEDLFFTCEFVTGIM